MATGMLIEGQWYNKEYVQDNQGRFQRQPTTFRSKISSDRDNPFQPEAGRYHLYVSLACPWAHRTLIMRKIKGLEDAISVSVVDPYMGDDGWWFSDFSSSIPDYVNHKQYLREIYVLADPQYTGRVTVPILWDKQTHTIVNNESREIIRMLDHEFQAIASNPTDYCPPELQEQIEQTIDAIYQPINNGVYRAGFATSQLAYEEAVTELFHHLDHWNEILGQQPYLCGEQITEADICMFTTLLRFDPVYYVHFKCNLRHIYEYPNLWRYLRSIYHYHGVKETCNIEHIKHHYYRSHPWLNPSGIIPKGPMLNLN
ncbi:MAG: glutathione S-transferase family protein [Snowella sp.]|nr:glutathione S-transferase family protein [Snowella sp.]